MDIITNLFFGARSIAAGLDPRLVAFLVKITLLLAVPSLLCSLSFQQGNTSKPLQVCWCVIGVLAIGLIPAKHLTVLNPTVRLCLVVATGLAIWFLPRLLAFLIEPVQGSQRKLTGRIYVVVAALVVLECFLRGDR